MAKSRWDIDVLLRHIKSIDPPLYNLEKKRELDPVSKRFKDMLDLMLSCIEDHDNKDQLQTSDSLASLEALVDLMDKPFTFLDLTERCSDLRQSAIRYLKTILKIQPNFFAPIYRRISQKFLQGCPQNDRSNHDCSNEQTLSLATCCYLYLREQSPTSSLELVQAFPQVITHESRLICCTPYVVALLERSEIIVHEKGLLLLESLLNQIERDSLDQKFFDLIETSSLSKQLIHIMVYSSSVTCRRLAYNMFTSICDLLTPNCKFRMLMQVLSQSDLRPSIRAVCIDQYRKHLVIVSKELISANQRSEIRKYKQLGGQALVEFLDLCVKTCIPESAQVDIIENDEIIMATLTMFRYLKLRKPVVRDEIEYAYLSSKRLKRVFFDPLQSAIVSMTNEVKRHQEDILKGVRAKNNDPRHGWYSPDESIAQFFEEYMRPKLNVDGNLLDLDWGEYNELDCLNWVLCRMDLMESILVRAFDFNGC